MAGVAVLQPQDVLKQQRLSYHRHSHVQPPTRSRKNTPLPNPNPNNNRRKRSPQKNAGSPATSPPAKNRHLLMGEVKILKRGEPLTNTHHAPEVVKKVTGGVVVEDFVLSTTDRLGPEPDMVPKQIRIGDFYAGSACVTSPPPSSLPVPAFFKKKTDCTGDATTDLRRLLRLDLS